MVRTRNRGEDGIFSKNMDKVDNYDFKKNIIPFYPYQTN
ncbi:hypothetical protein M23134_01165 [Microscilla marina ATCC 23134]|uniref:Uncharacterized protein n=1 Tax=Microscilla marina ATCC 23134 TaxID=313606 RepID=A1ZFR7_MICM2|nr:hypothetical protein M23134_01165 [Microscilla marina ATCC 23134]